VAIVMVVQGDPRQGHLFRWILRVSIQHFSGSRRNRLEVPHRPDPSVWRFEMMSTFFWSSALRP